MLSPFSKKFFWRQWRWWQVWKNASCYWLNFGVGEGVLVIFFWPDLSNSILDTLLVNVLKQPLSLGIPAGLFLGSTSKLNLGHQRSKDSSSFSHPPFLFPFWEFVFNWSVSSSLLSPLFIIKINRRNCKLYTNQLISKCLNYYRLSKPGNSTYCS